SYRTLEPDVEPRQSDIVIKVERIGDLLVDVLTAAAICSSLAFPALATRPRKSCSLTWLSSDSEGAVGGRKPTLRQSGYRPARLRRRPGIIFVNNGGGELIIDRSGHAHAQEGDSGTRPGTKTGIGCCQVGRCAGTLDSALLLKVRCASGVRDAGYAGLRD